MAFSSDAKCETTKDDMFMLLIAVPQAHWGKKLKQCFVAVVNNI